MRDFLDSVLAFLDLESMTDPEWEAVEASLEGYEADYNMQTYDALDDTLKDREETFDTRQRLTNLYLAKGVEVNPAAEVTPKSNIFIGDVL